MKKITERVSSYSDTLISNYGVLSFVNMAEQLATCTAAKNSLALILQEEAEHEKFYQLRFQRSGTK